MNAKTENPAITSVVPKQLPRCQMSLVASLSFHSSSHPLVGSALGAGVGGRVSKAMVPRVTADDVGTASKVVLVAASWMAVTRSVESVCASFRSAVTASSNASAFEKVPDALIDNETSKATEAAVARRRLLLRAAMAAAAGGTTPSRRVLASVTTTLSMFDALTPAMTDAKPVWIEGGRRWRELSFSLEGEGECSVLFTLALLIHLDLLKGEPVPDSKPFTSSP